MIIIQDISKSLMTSFEMFWQILWPLILGFGISAAIQTVVSHGGMAKAFPDSSPKTLLKVTGLGAASSSCSYAAVAIARSIFRKGANFTAAIVFEFASTNLVIELGIVMLILLGWQFTLAEFIGGPLMIIILAIIFRIFLKNSLIEKARVQANKGLAGQMEGHASMDMTPPGDTARERLLSKEGLTAVSHYFAMDWISIWRDIALGLLIAGALAALVSTGFWQIFFFSHSGLFAKIWGPIIGPVVSLLSFVCSVGNVPLAAVLWNGGISFGGVIAFIFADLIIIPILNIYRKYYGFKMAAFILVASYAAMVLASFIIELLFGALNLIPQQRNLSVIFTHISFNYTSVLNIIFLIVGGVLIYRFLKTGGPKMLQHMQHMQR